MLRRCNIITFIRCNAEGIGHVILALANAKGGVGKTTSTIYTAHVLAREGKTLVIDSDPQSSALSWSSMTGHAFPFDVISLAVKDLHKRVPSLAEGYQHVIIDTPPGDMAILRSALLAADTVLIPLSPSGLDIDRLSATLDALTEIENINAPQIGVLLTKVRAGTTSRKLARETLGDEFRLPLLESNIPLKEAYTNAFGATVDYLDDYAAVIDELRKVKAA